VFLKYIHQGRRLAFPGAAVKVEGISNTVLVILLYRLGAELGQRSQMIPNPLFVDVEKAAFSPR
jgi:hypothetical protein